MEYTRYFRYQSDNENMAVEEMKLFVKNEGLNVVSGECVFAKKAEDLPDDWFDDYSFLIKVKFESDLPKEEIEEKLLNISEYDADYTNIESPDKLVSIVENDYMMQDTEFSTEFLDYDVKMTEEDILSAYVEMQKEFNGDTVEIPEGDYSKIYEGNLKQYIEKCNELEGFKRFDDEEELDFAF